MVNLLSIRPGGGLSAKRSPRLAVGTRRKCFQHTRHSKIPGTALQSKVAPPPHHGQRSDTEVKEIFESFKERFKQCKGIPNMIRRGM